MSVCRGSFIERSRGTGRRFESDRWYKPLRCKGCIFVWKTSGASSILAGGTLFWGGVMTNEELLVVAGRVKNWKNPRCWAWRDKYRLPLTDALKCPQYGWPSFGLASFRGELTEISLVQAIRDIYNFFYEKTGERYTKTLLSDAYKVFIPNEFDIRLCTQNGTAACLRSKCLPSVGNCRFESGQSHYKRIFSSVFAD